MFLYESLYPRKIVCILSEFRHDASGDFWRSSNCFRNPSGLFRDLPEPLIFRFRATCAGDVQKPAFVPKIAIWRLYGFTTPSGAFRDAFIDLPEMQRKSPQSSGIWKKTGFSNRIFVLKNCFSKSLRVWFP